MPRSQGYATLYDNYEIERVMLDTKAIYMDSTTGIWKSPLVSAISIAYLRYLLREKEINAFLKQYGDLPAREFIGEIFHYLNVDYQMKLNSDAELPVSGRGIVVANHPLGGLDGLMLLHAMLSVRSDVKIVVNHILAKIKPLTPYIIPVKNWRSDYPRQSIMRLREGLQQDELVIFFPSGEVSRERGGKIQDGPWQKACLSLAKSCDAPLIPVFVDGRNSKAFYLISKIAPNLSTAMLAREMWQQRNRCVGLYIGKALPIQMLQSLPLPDKQIIQLIRQHVYQLKSPDQGVFSAQQPLAEPLYPHLVHAAIETTTMLGKVGEAYNALLYQPQKNAVLLQEIGRLREATFRQVGEGTGTPRDLDPYDSYYQHLLVWHDKSQSLMGAYRLYPSVGVLEGRGIEALYTQLMFDFEGDLAWLGEGLELGRAFIVPKHWNSRALDMMWQGIGAYYARSGKIRYLFGSVSISPHYPKEAVDCLVALYTIYMSSREKKIRAKNPYAISTAKLQKWQAFFAGMSFAEAERAAKTFLKKQDLVIPTLFKHYCALCDEGGVTFAEFAVDPDYGFTVDGFVIVDMHKLKKEKYARYIAPYERDSAAPEKFANESTTRRG